MKKRLLSLFIAALLTLPIAAGCSKPGDSSVTTAPPDNTDPDPTVTSAPETQAGPTTAERLGFEKEDNGGRTFTILSNSTSSYEFNVESITGDLIDDAVFRKDRLVEEYLGIKLNIVLENGSWNQRAVFNQKITQAVGANDPCYDLVSNMLVCTIPLASSGVFVEGKSLPYADFDHSWWLADMYDNFSICGKLYGFLGEYSLSLYKDMSVFFFNKDIWEAQKADVNLYQIVRDDAWTLDKFIELCSDMAVDLNGDTVITADDQQTFIGEQVPRGAMQVSLGLQVIEHDETGAPKFVGLTEKFENAYQKMLAFYQNTPGIFKCSSINNASFTSMKMFAEGKAASMFNFIYATEHLRDMDADYGILPMPKYDASQEKYLTQIGTSTSTLFVPISAGDIALTSKVMECESYFGSIDVAPSYYETVLKVKYASDPDMVEMLDMIRDGAVIDFACVYSTALNSSILLNAFFRFDASYTSLAPIFKTLERVAEKSLENLAKSYSGLD